MNGDPFVRQDVARAEMIEFVPTLQTRGRGSFRLDGDDLLRPEVTQAKTQPIAIRRSNSSRAG